MHDFTDKVVVITGAAGNVGQAAANAFHGAHANLALVDRRSDRLAGIFPQFAEIKNHLLLNNVDLSDEEKVNRGVDEIITRFGRIDVLVNTAGGYRAGQTLEETGLETWDLMFKLNAQSVFLVSKAVIPHMKAQSSGKIINISALAALSGKPKMAVYLAAKDAVIRLSESMAEELRSFKINVNTLLPSTIDTPSNRAANPNSNYDNWVKPGAIAEVILFLATPAARSIYGASIPVRGPC